MLTITNLRRATTLSAGGGPCLRVDQNTVSVKYSKAERNKTRHACVWILGGHHPAQNVLHPLFCGLYKPLTCPEHLYPLLSKATAESGHQRSRHPNPTPETRAAVTTPQTSGRCESMCASALGENPHRPQSQTDGDGSSSASPPLVPSARAQPAKPLVDLVRAAGGRPHPPAVSTGPSTSLAGQVAPGEGVALRLRREASPAPSSWTCGDRTTSVPAPDSGHRAPRRQPAWAPPACSGGQGGPGKVTG